LGVSADARWGCKPVSSSWLPYLAWRRAPMQPSCPHCDQPDISLLRLVLIGELLCIDEPLLLCLADVMQQCGLLQLADTVEEPAPVQRKPR
jgi:hypothetical protein